MKEHTMPRNVLPFCLLLASAAAATDAASWRDASYRAVLRNDALEAHFQAGLPFQLTSRVSGKVLASADPEKLPARLQPFGETGIDLDACEVDQAAKKDSLVVRLIAKDGTEWTLRWSIEPGQGDLVLRTSARTPKPVKLFRFVLPGCDIAEHGLVTVSGNGKGSIFRAPWKERFEDVAAKGFSARYVHPLVALFEGKKAGWFLEGRDPRIGPANLFCLGRGQTADMILLRGFPLGTKTPEMYEIRLRSYKGQWFGAVDPYVDWLEHDVGFVPIDKKPQKWVRNIRTQAYVPVGNFDALEALAKRLDPAKTLLGRMGGYRPYAFDANFPNYTPGADAVRWFRRARELGFHVGAHVNTTGVDPCYPELIDRFKKGFLEIKKDAQGKETWEGPGPSHGGRITFDTKDGPMTAWGVPPTLVYSTAANADWRRHLIECLRPLVEAGVDMIYLDESMACCGKFVVDGTNAVEGVMALERELLDTYPHVAIETEQINTQNARWSSFALTTLKLGHPLGGYIYHRFVKIVPESAFYEPTDETLMDQFQAHGFIIPGASKEESWLQIAEAFQKLDLEPAPRLPRETYQLSGWRGPSGATAFFEKHPGKRGLVVYQAGKQPQWFGTRITGVKEWAGPGALRDWAVYRGDTLLALDSKQTYVFDKSITLRPDRFHVTEIPKDFSLHTDMTRRIRAQFIGKNRSFYKITFTGRGEMAMCVPDEVLVFLDGRGVPVDRKTKTARVKISAPAEKPSVLLAFTKSNMQLVGKWASLPWEWPPQERAGFVNGEGDGFFQHVAGTGQIIGKLPRAKSIRLKGSWGMGSRPKSLGHAVVRINGKQVLRIPPGEEPFKPKTFDVDVTSFAGRHILLEFSVDGVVAGFSPSNWQTPRIVVERDAAAPAVGSPGPANKWNTSAAIKVRASSSHATCVPANVINGSGISPDGMTHDPADPTNKFVTGPMVDSKANPRGGTVKGGHWIEFAFDRAYRLGEMWIWNFDSRTDSYDWRIQGLKQVTIQYSTTGGGKPADWTTIYEGPVPQVVTGAATPISLIIDFGGAEAKYVTITTADAPEHNWSNAKASDAGLSEVRFYLER